MRVIKDEPPCVRSQLLEDLRTRLLTIADDAEDRHFRIRGIWSTRYWLRLLDDSTPFDLQYLLVQTSAMGCCYLPAGSRELDHPANYVGASVFDEFDNLGLEIAALDAAYAALVPPSELHVFSGENFEKSRARAKLLCGEVKRLMPRRENRPGCLGLVGVVGEVLHELSSWSDVVIRATDYAPRVVGARMEDVEIEWGDETDAMVRAVDVALVTGMTLANGTLEDIVAAAKEGGTKLVVFAQTGHNFAARYLDLGVDAVVSEEFPFYLSGPGLSNIRIARAPDAP